MTTYFMDSGLHRSYPATGLGGAQNPTGGINHKFRIGTKCVKCGNQFIDGDVAYRGRWEGRSGFRHEACQIRNATPSLDTLMLIRDAAVALLSKRDSLTTDEFQLGGEREGRSTSQGVGVSL